MITFVTGKPGDGKTMYGMKLIVDAILNTDKVIATNIAVKLPELRAYCILKGWKPKPGNDIQERVMILQHEDVFEFYRHRSNGYKLPPSPDWVQARFNEERGDEKKKDKLSRYQLLRILTGHMQELKKHKKALRPIEYHIDEAHDYFSAREWTDTGRGILWYASKHRHLHDEIILYTQVMANVEAQLRGLASFTVRARNQLRMRWGPFRKAPIFRLYHYYGGPEDTDKCVPFDKGVMQLDREGLCKTYNSAGALAVHSKPEEIKNKAPLPYWAMPAMGAAILLFFVCFIAGAPMLMGKYAGSKIKQSTAETAKSLGVPDPHQSNASVTSPQSVQKTFMVPNGKATYDAPVTIAAKEVEKEDKFSKVVGVMSVGKRVLVGVKGYEWSALKSDIGGGLLELENGVVVRKLDVLNPR